MTRRPTACRSAAASAPPTTFKNERSCARSGRLQRRVRRSGRGRLGCLPHVPTTPASYHISTTGVRSESHASGITPGRTGLEWNHAEHNGLSYHAWHNGQSAQRAFVPDRHNERRHDGGDTTRLQDVQITPSKMKRNGNHVPRTPNGMRMSRRPCGESITKSRKRWSKNQRS